MFGKKRKSILTYLILGVGVLIIVLPILFVVISSFKTRNELYSSPYSLPQAWDISPYIKLFTKYKMHINFRNSLIYSVIGCVGILALVVPAAYAVSRMKWKLSKLVMSFLMSGLMISTHAVVIPLYISTSQLGIPRVAMLVIIYIATSIPSSLFFLTGFLQGIPRAMEESAVLDGASLRQAFLHVIFPMLAPALATITILNFNGIWNDYMLSLIYINDKKYDTIQLLVASFSGVQSSNYPMMLSSIVIAFIPSVVVAATMGDKIANGMTAGAVKE